LATSPPTAAAAAGDAPRVPPCCSSFFARRRDLSCSLFCCSMRVRRCSPSTAGSCRTYCVSKSRSSRDRCSDSCRWLVAGQVCIQRVRKGVRQETACC
jgi:hypothetical protein